MSFFEQLRTLYKLYKTGELDSITSAIQPLKDKKDLINISLSALEKDVAASKKRLGQAQDTLVRQSLNLPGDIDSDSMHASFETTYRVIAAGCSPFFGWTSRKRKKYNSGTDSVCYGIAILSYVCEFVNQ